MFDQTLTVECIFTAIGLGLGLVALVWIWSIARKIQHSVAANQGKLPDVLWNTRWQGVAWLAFVVLVGGFYYRFETAYRPKTEIHSTASASRQDDSPQERPVMVEPVAQPTFEEVSKRNRLQNEEAKKEFMKLPAADKP